MKIAVFGSTGRTGRIIVNKALSQGNKVTAFLRNPEALSSRHERLTIVQGDVLHPETVDLAVRGQDVVLSALGVGLGSDQPVLSEGARNIVDAMERFDVSRFICLSSYGSGDSYQDAPLVMRAFFSIGPRRAYADKQIQDDIIRRSKVAWVVIRPTRFTNGPERGAYRVGEHLSLGLFTTISRADTAEFMLKQLTSDDWLYRFPQLSY